MSSSTLCSELEKKIKENWRILCVPFKDGKTHIFMMLILLISITIIWLIISIIEIIFFKTNNTLCFKSHTNLKLQMSAILGTCASLSIPFALNAVVKHADKYTDREIRTTVLEDEYFKLMLYYVIPLIALLVLASYLFESQKIVDAILYLMFGYALLILLGFLRRLSSYASSFEEIIKQKYKSEADECIKQ